MSALTNEWYIFEGALDKKTCNKIKRLARNNWEESSVDTSKGITDEERKTGRKGDFKPDPKTRISDIAWITDQWVYDTIWPYMQEANQEAGWGYHIKAAESMQITRYRKGGFYNFHRDGNGDHLSAYYQPDNAFMHGHVRKLSMTTLLSDSYEGGEFQFASYGKEECKISIPEFSKVGSIVVFPSSMEHRVAPVTKGIRHSLVTWFVGPPFV